MGTSGTNSPGYRGIAYKLLSSFSVSGRMAGCALGAFLKKLFLLSFLLSFSIPAFAEGVVSVGCGYKALPRAGNCLGPSWMVYSSAAEACSSCGPNLTPYFSPEFDQSCGHVVGYCNIGNSSSPLYLSRFWFPDCPPHSSGSATTFCTCDADFEPDPAKTSCVPNDCPVKPLKNPPFSDACSTSLEAGKGEDVNNKCGRLRDDMDKAASCIADKIKALSTPKVDYSNPSATIRTEAYQNHLLEIWTKSQQFDTIMNGFVYTLETKQACAASYASVLAEKQSHGIDAQPSSSGKEAPHVERRAIDVPRKIAKALIKQVTIYATTFYKVNGKTKSKRVVVSDVEDYIHSATVNPPACDANIGWGGNFKKYDPVHFQLP